MKRYTQLPYEEDPFEDDDLDAEWKRRQRVIEREEHLSGEVYEQDRRKEPKHISAKVGAANSRTRARGTTGALSARQWRAIIRAFRSCCAYCGEFVRLPILEHVLPVAQGGHTSVWNVVPACRTCNATKRGRNPLEWFGRDDAALAAFVARVTAAAKQLTGDA